MSKKQTPAASDDQQLLYLAYQVHTLAQQLWSQLYRCQIQASTQPQWPSPGPNVQRNW